MLIIRRTSGPERRSAGLAEAHGAWGREYQGLAVLLGDRINIIANAGVQGYVASLPHDLMNALGVIFVLVCAWPVARKLGLAYAAFILVFILPPLAAGGLISAGRFSSVLFPTFVWMAGAVPPRHRAAWLASFAAIQALNAAMFYTWRPPLLRIRCRLGLARCLRPEGLHYTLALEISVDPVPSDAAARWPTSKEHGYNTNQDETPPVARNLSFGAGGGGRGSAVRGAGHRPGQAGAARRRLRSATPSGCDVRSSRAVTPRSTPGGQARRKDPNVVAEGVCRHRAWVRGRRNALQAAASRAPSSERHGTGAAAAAEPARRERHADARGALANTTRNAAELARRTALQALGEIPGGERGFRDAWRRAETPPSRRRGATCSSRSKQGRCDLVSGRARADPRWAPALVGGARALETTIRRRRPPRQARARDQSVLGGCTCLAIRP